MSVLPIELRPTFPLDEDRIRRMKRDLIWRSPRLVVGQALWRLATAVKAAGFSAETSLANRCLDWWSDIDQDLTAQVVRRLVDESNQSQDESIRTMILHLEDSGRTQYAISLGRVLLLKQHIESGLHRDGELTRRKKEIEKLVDSICQEVCNELFRIADSNDQLANILTSRNEQQLHEASDELRARHARIMQAYATLYDTANQLGVEYQPMTASSGQRIENAVLDRLIDNLREENELAKTVDERIRTELPRLDR